MKRLTRGILFSLSLIGVLASANNASAAPGDYDGNGVSDLAAVQVDRTAQSTYWFVRLSPGGQTTGYNFSGAADALVSGRYFAGDPKTYPGIVRVRSASTPLEWTIKNAQGNNVTVFFGLPGDTIPNQGDLDCDGVTDFVVSRNGRPGYYDGFKLWYAALSSSHGAVQELLFGLAGDRVGTADMDGDGCSELVVLRGDFTWYARRMFNDFVTAVQWGLPGDTALLPQDFTGDGNADYVVARTLGSQMFGIVRGAGGAAELFPLGSPTSVPMIGNFIGVPSFAWVERIHSLVGVMNFDRTATVIPFGNLPTNHIVRPDGTVIDPLVGSTPTSSSSAPRCDFQIKRPDGSGGFKNNPENSKGTIKLMFPKVPFTGNIAVVKAFAPSGDLFDTLRWGGSLEWGDRERYYGTRPLSSYPMNLLIQVNMKNGQTHCTTLENPRRVYE